MRHLIIALVVALVATFLSWGLIGELLPAAEFLLYLNIVPLLGGAMISGSHAGPSEGVFLVLVFVQWFIVGFLLSIVFSKVFR